MLWKSFCHLPSWAHLVRNPSLLCKPRQVLGLNTTINFSYFTQLFTYRSDYLYHDQICLHRLCNMKYFPSHFLLDL